MGYWAASLERYAAQLQADAGRVGERSAEDFRGLPLTGYRLLYHVVRVKGGALVIAVTNLAVSAVPAGCGRA